MIALKNVSLELTGRKILQDISLQIEEGTVSIILGPSGVGKSTILKIILGLQKVDSGKLIIDGMDVTGNAADGAAGSRKKIVMVFQGNALFDSLTVEQNAAYFLKENKAISSEEVRRKVREALAFVNLSGAEMLYPEQLSGGMKKRLAIARALVLEPKIILFDEPTTGLDPINAKNVLDLIRELKAKGTTSVIVTHIINDAIAVGDTMTVLNEGKVVLSGSAREVLQSDNPFIREFLYEIYDDSLFLKNKNRIPQGAGELSV